MVNVIFYCLIVFWVAQAYYTFYKSGGIKGTAATRKDYELFLSNAATFAKD